MIKSWRKSPAYLLAGLIAGSAALLPAHAQSIDVGINAAVRNAFIRGLWLERKQGFDESDYTLPVDIFDNPNDKIKTERFVTKEYQAELKQRVFKRFNLEIEKLCA